MDSIFSNCKNSKKQGEIGVASAINYFVRKGYIVSIPLEDNQEYDLIVDNGKLCKVQVKTVSFKAPSGAYEACIKTSGGNQSWNKISKTFDKTKVDILFILCANNEMYDIPSDKVDSVNSIRLGFKYEQYRVDDL